MQLEEKIFASFIRARYAAWAGDVDHCRMLLTELHSESTKISEQNRSGAYGLIFRAADQLSQRLSEQDENETMFPIETFHWKQLITSNHLRAIIHRTADFEFEVRAYLDDLSWEESLYARATAIAAEQTYNVRDEKRPEGEDKSTRVKHLRRPSKTWRMVEDHLVCNISVGPFCLIVMKGTWTEAQPPTDIDQVRPTFERALKQIDSEAPTQSRQRDSIET